MPRSLVRHRLRPRSLPPRRVGLRARLRLSAEILISYAELLVLLRRNDLPTMVAGARRVHVERIPLQQHDDPHDTALRIGRMVQRVVTKLPTDKRCLINSLVVVRMLSHRAIDSSVVIGVQSDSSGFRAHAWVEHDDRPVLPPWDYERLLEL